MKNKKVFVLLGGYDYEGYDVLGVYLTRKKAEANKGGGFDNYKIVEWNINGKEVKKRVKKISKEESEKRRKRFFELNAPFFQAMNEQAAKILSPEYDESFRGLFLRTALPSSDKNDKRSVATGGDSSNSADTIEKENYEYERGNE